MAGVVSLPALQTSRDQAVPCQMLGVSTMPPACHLHGWTSEPTFARGHLCKVPAEPDNSFIELYKNHNLMTPSERYRDFLKIRDGEKQWRADKRAKADYKKRVLVLERQHRTGVLGVDSMMHEGTENYIRAQQEHRCESEQREAFGERRHEFLANQRRASDEVAHRDYGEPVKNQARGSSVPLQRKLVDPTWHPHRFLDTHNRLFPSHAPIWDPERAMSLLTHDRRGRDWCLITGKEGVTELTSLGGDAPE